MPAAIAAEAAGLESGAAAAATILVGPASGTAAEAAGLESGAAGAPTILVGPASATPAGAGSPRLVCEAAASLMRRHSKGVQRIPLERMGISPFNRRINGLYVHKLGKRILTVEGFARLRYQQGWCHEPNPEDPLAVARCTNAAAKGSGLLAPVPMVPLFGSFAKSHLLSFLQALKFGQI